MCFFSCKEILNQLPPQREITLAKQIIHNIRSWHELCECGSLSSHPKFMHLMLNEATVSVPEITAKHPWGHEIKMKSQRGLGFGWLFKNLQFVSPLLSSVLAG